MNFKRYLTFFIFFFCLSWLNAGEQVKEKDIFGRKYAFVGTALIEVTIFKIDVYQASYFKSKKGELFQLHYLMDVSRKHSFKGWDEGFKWLKDKRKIPEYKNALKWIYDNTNDLKKGDNFFIEVLDDEVIFSKNSTIVGKTEDKVVREIVLTPWLGPVPLDKRIKRKLLGKD